MFSYRRRRLVALSAMATLVFAAVAVANHSWGNYHWARTENPFTLKLGDNVSGAWDPILVTTSNDWSVSTVLDTTIVAGSANPKNCRPTSGMVEVCNSKYGNNGWLGIAQIWASGDHITQGVVKVNDSYYTTAKYNTTAWRNLVMCQEVGHTLGLDHQDETFDNPNLGTCMDYTNDPSTNQHPNAHDYNQLVSIYSHLDGTTTVSSASATQRQPPAMNDVALDGPPQWGKVIRSSNGGRTELFELDFGNGHKVFTFVIWSDEDRPGRPQ